MIPLCVPKIEGNEWKYIQECLQNNEISSVGGYIDRFESGFQLYTGSKAAVAVMNGTTALTLALKVLGIGPGDEVIVPSMTFIASVNPIRYCGAEPVFVDITPDTWVMDVNKVEELITHRTKAIIPVHIYGNVVDMDPLLRMAREYNLYIIEDATEALGAEYGSMDGTWHKAGSMGDIGVFSFNGNKLITTGAGGMLVGNDVYLAARARYLCNQAKTVLENGAMVHEEIGYNYRMPNILAALGAAQLEKAQKYVDIKRNQADSYTRLLKGVKGIQLPCQKENVRHCHWLYSALITGEFHISRNEVINNLKGCGIMSRPFFCPVHRMKPYTQEKSGNMAVTDQISEWGINLPSTVGLADSDIEYICRCIKVG